MADIDNTPGPEPEPPQLRFLRVLVTVLTGVMILGLLTIIGLLVMRFQADFAQTTLPLPDALTLPEGTTAAAVTYMSDRILVVTEAGQVLVYGTDGTQIGEMILKDLDES